MTTALSTWREHAHQMLVNAQIKPIEAAVEALALDLQALDKEMAEACEGFSPLQSGVLGELNRRIGGLKNLQSYVDCLLVPER
jgi:hypothetical protein